MSMRAKPRPEQAVLLVHQGEALERPAGLDVAFGKSQDLAALEAMSQRRWPTQVASWICGRSRGAVSSRAPKSAM
jgi:hypothetical protein